MFIPGFPLDSYFDLSFSYAVMVARIHLTNMPLVEDGKIYRRIFGGYGLGVAAIPYF